MPDIEIRHWFKRNSCACPSCSRHCRHMPGCLGPNDLERIGTFLETHPLETEAFFVASPGALASLNGKTFRIGTIVPRKTEAGHCVFLAEDGKCSIHPVAPFGCAYFDDHISEREASARRRALYEVLMLSDQYRADRERIASRHGMTCPPEQARAQYEGQTNGQGHR